ncbi:hypothetical protein GHK92_02505 [Nocardioides sp. dk4132]|uniref:hypothetical protein n=1 Tax=unclassified Nocardioides TaxID=2615069 RepID=UPI0012972832|nr:MULTISPECIES: hypothetical protein [unclassified Nocardioides]MQW74734.1 hypothetical protein [Nocardioides sp. dk4132]QGA06636.1 hypothetical protein GFH29_03945 [Nocardioides sp. dk884]
MHRTVNERGPDAVDVDVWWQQEEESYGTKLHDILWDTGLSQVKIVSARAAQVLRDAGGVFETFDVQVRRRDGSLVDGYVGIHEDDQTSGPVHSARKGRRSARMVVDDQVLAAIKDAGLTGFEVEAVASAFPRDTADS